MRKRWYLIIGTFICLFVLRWTGQTPFPYFEARMQAGQDILGEAKWESGNYKTYIFLKKDELVLITYQRRLFWHNNVRYSYRREDLVTINYCEYAAEQYSIVFGCRNSERIARIDITENDGNVVPVELNEEGIFISERMWTNIREVCAYDASGKLIWQSFPGN